MEQDGKKIVLRKELGLYHSIALGIGGLIGSGIFVSPVGILSHVGSIGTSMIIWIACGICQLLFALCYAELGCRIPLSGSDYIYLKVVCGGLIACMRLWSAVCIFILSQSVFNGIFAQYLLEPLFITCSVPKNTLPLLYVICLFTVTAINCYSVKLVVRLQVFFTSTKLLALGGVILLGIIYMGFGEAGQLSDPFQGSNKNPASYALAFYSGIWALSGWEYLCCVVGEMKNPRRDLRLGLVTSISITTVIYILANIAYAAVLTKEEMLASPAVAVAFAQKTMGPVSWIMPLCISISVFGSSVGSILAHSRIFYMGAKEGHLPGIMKYISIKWRTPIICLIIMAMIALTGVIWDGVFYAIEYVGFLIILFQAITMIALMVLRHREPNPGEGILMAPFLVPEISLCILCILMVLTLYQRPVSTSVMLLLVFVCFTVIYLVCVRWKKKPRKYFEIRDYITRTLQKLFLCLPEDD